MTSQTSCPRDLSDGDLLSEVERAATCERQATARLIALLREVDLRKLYVGQGYSSLFTYCVQRLHLSEHAAYLRIEAARSARRFPAILEKLFDGSVHLTAVSLLRPHLSDTNHVELLTAATHKSKREVEQLLAQWRPQPDVQTVIRKLPTPTQVPVLSSESPVRDEPSELVLAAAAPASVAMRPPEIKPLAPERYKVQFTVSHETHAKLRRVQDLMRHAIPDGDPAAIFDRALTLLLGDLLKVKCGATEHPRNGRPAQWRSRHIPAAVKRDVWHRDGGRCAFQGDQGRCTETGLNEHWFASDAEARRLIEAWRVAFVAKLAIEAFDERVFDRLAWPNKPKLHPARVRPRVERRPLNSGPLSITSVAGRPHVSASRSSTRTTRRPGNDRSTSIATHSRVKSSTTFSVQKPRPSASVSTMKSIDQRSPRRLSAGNGTRCPRVRRFLRAAAPATPPRD